MKNLKILLIGEFYSDNLGDGVLCEVVYKLISDNISTDITKLDLSARNNYGDYYIYTNTEKILLKIIKRIQKIFNLYPAGKINMLFKKKYFQKIFQNDYDIVIFAGGQLFMDWFVIPISMIIDICNKKHLPIIFHACGAKQIDNKYLINKLQKTLSNQYIKSISIRDDINLVNEVYLKYSNIIATETFDSALLSKQIFSNITKTSSEFIGLGIMSVPSIKDEQIIHFWLNIIKILEKKHISYKLFCNGSDGDYKLLRKLLVIKNLSEKEYSLPKPKTPSDLVYSITRFKSIISFRLHSHIIATSYSIPSIAIIREKKVPIFFSKIGLLTRCKTLDTNCIDIVKALEQAEIDGIDKQLILKQGIASKFSLLNNIKNVLNK